MNNQRKHRQQCKREEIAAAERTIHSIRSWDVLPHAIKRGCERVISNQDILDTLNIGDFIEIHNNVPGEIRVVVRHETVIVAASLTTRKVVSVWFNAAEDMHNTLDWNAYRWSVNVLQVLPQ